MSLRPEERNHLLASLPNDGLDRLRPHMERVQLTVRMSLENPGERITHVFFPLSGICSVLATVGRDRIEVGIIGRDGMTGVSAVLGDDIAPLECFVQVAGEALRIAVGELHQVIESNPATRKQLLLYARSLMVQTAQTALANGRLTIEQRLIRWLLKSQDRLDGDEIPLTHEFLSLMLGVTRPGVTVAVQALEAARLIGNRRGCITILDRPALETIIGEAYAKS